MPLLSTSQSPLSDSYKHVGGATRCDQFSRYSPDFMFTMVMQKCELLFWNSASKNDNGDATEDGDCCQHQTLCDDFIEK